MCTYLDPTRRRMKHERGPSKWEAQTVRHKNEPRQTSWFVFSHLLPLPATNALKTHTAPTAQVTTATRANHTTNPGAGKPTTTRVAYRRRNGQQRQRHDTSTANGKEGDRIRHTHTHTAQRGGLPPNNHRCARQLRVTPNEDAYHPKTTCTADRQRHAPLPFPEQINPNP
jgi:hypothetical protein